jgi:predicted metalloprotease with PDZ domain
MSCTPTNIHRSKVNVAKKDVDASYTYVTKVLSIKVAKISSTNTFFNGKTTFGHNL